MADEPLELMLRWEKLCLELLERTARFPRSDRFTFGARLDEAALDVLVLLVDARYRTGSARAEALTEVNLRISRLRVLLRLAHRRRLVAQTGYEACSEQLDEAGRMLGGWLQRVRGSAGTMEVT